jgi:hypothetical protein
MARTYKQQIMSWAWSGIVGESKINAMHVVTPDVRGMADPECNEGCDESGHTGQVYLGSVMSLAPSGKFYTFWTTNQTNDDIDRDSRWYTALEAVATKYEGWIESGEGDPTDLFFCRYWPKPNLNIN